MSPKILILGSVALGPKVACRVKRMLPEAEVTMIDKDELISYGGCGIPYFVGGDVADIEGLQSTSAHVVRDERFFQNAKGVRVMTACEALAIDRSEKKVHVRHLKSDQEQTLAYDKLVLATGATPICPPIPGAQLPGVSVVSNLHHAQRIKSMVSKGQVGRAVVIGGGAIGIEMTEALADLWGIETTLVEMLDQVLPVPIGPDMARVIQNHMQAKGVSVRLNEKVKSIEGNAERGVTAVVTDSGELPCDLVVIAAGVRPNTTLAQQAGLAVGEMGGLLVDDNLRTTDPNIYAGGDCIEVPHLISGERCHFSLGSLANRQGRVIGTNLAGGHAQFKGSVGNFCLKVFDIGVFRAGLTVAKAKAAGFDPVYTVVAQADRAHFYPTQDMMVMKLIACGRNRQIVGVEAIGPDGDAVKARVDAIAVLLAHKPSLEDIANLEVSYSPPYASAMDIINNAANSLENIIDGRHQPVDADQFQQLFTTDAATRVLDVRSAAQAEEYTQKYGARWQNIPQEELSLRLDELSNHEGPTYLICGSGPRAYEAQLLMRRHGFDETYNVQGGMKMLQASDPDFAPAK